MPFNNYGPPPPYAKDPIFSPPMQMRREEVECHRCGHPTPVAIPVPGNVAEMMHLQDKMQTELNALRQLVAVLIEENGGAIQIDKKSMLVVPNGKYELDVAEDKIENTLTLSLKEKKIVDITVVGD